MGTNDGALGLNPDPFITACGGLLLGEGFSGDGTGLPTEGKKVIISNNERDNHMYFNIPK